MTNSKDQKIRCFFCIDLPQELKQKINDFIVGLRRIYPEIKWVRYQGLHITLKFIGEIKQTKVERLIKSADSVLKSVLLEDFLHLSIKGVGSFPDWSRPRVLWLGVEGDLDGLNILWRAVQKASKAEGFPVDKKPFTPHLTIARLRPPFRIDSKLRETLHQHSESVFGDFFVKEVILNRSILKPSGAEYTPIKIFNLAFRE